MNSDPHTVSTTAAAAAAAPGTCTSSGRGGGAAAAPVLLPAAVAEAIRTLRWSLDAPPAPMRFLPLERLAAPIVIANHHGGSGGGSGGSSASVLGTVALLRSRAEAAATATNSSTSNNDENNNDKNDEAEHWARIATALLLLGHGHCDHAHNLVGPLSFPQPLAYFYGPPVACRPATLAAASVAHCLVHRREGFHESEFHQTGVDNAQYWAGAALRSGGEETLPLAALQRAVRQQVEAVVQHKKKNATAAAAAASWWEAACRDHYRAAEWDPRPVTELCATVLEYREAHRERHVLQELAERAALAELRGLLRHALAQLGWFDAGTAGTAAARPLTDEGSDAAATACVDPLLSSSSSSTTATTTEATATTTTTNNDNVAAQASPPQRLPQTLEEALQRAPLWQDRALVVTTAAAPHRIVHVNPAWVRLCGHAEPQARGQTLGILQGRDTDHTVARTAVRTCRATRQPQEAYLVNYTATGERFLNHLTIGPLRATAASASAEYMVGILEKVDGANATQHHSQHTSPVAV